MNEENIELVTVDEQAVLEQIAAGQPPESQRARAILASAEGATLEQAATQSNLTPNQVRYWWGRFRTGRLAVFPEGLLTAVAEADTLAEQVEAAVEPVAEEETAAGVPKEKESAKKKKKKPDSKKKKAKKEEKPKKKKPDSKKNGHSKNKKKNAGAKKKKGKKKKDQNKGKKGKKKKNDAKSKKKKSKKK